MSEQPNLVFPSALRSDADAGNGYISFILDKETSPDTGSAVNLYIPSGIAQSDSINYNTADLGLARAAEKFREAKESGSDAESSNAILNAIIKEGVAKGGLTGGAAQAIQLQKREALNPFTSVLFESTGIRQHDFSFNLIPESAEESKTIKEIVTFFKKYMYPEALGGNAAALSLKYPPLFEIKFYVGGDESPYLPKIFKSYLTSMSTTFNSSVNSFHPDGSPVETLINLSFQEAKALVRQEVMDPANADLNSFSSSEE